VIRQQMRSRSRNERGEPGQEVERLELNRGRRLAHPVGRAAHERRRHGVAECDRTVDLGVGCGGADGGRRSVLPGVRPGGDQLLRECDVQSVERGERALVGAEE